MKLHPKYRTFLSTKCICKYHLQNDDHFIYISICSSPCLSMNVWFNEPDHVTDIDKNRIVLMWLLEGYIDVYFLSFKARKEINTTITLEWAQKQFVMRAQALFYFLHNIITPYITKDNLHIDSVSCSPCCSADDVTINSWWCHNDPTVVTCDKRYLTC